MNPELSAPVLALVLEARAAKAAFERDMAEVREMFAQMSAALDDLNFPEDGAR